jgi:hypothetical protein
MMLAESGANTTPYLPQTIFLTTTGNFNWTVLPYKNNVTVSVWGAGAAGSPSFGSMGATGVSSLFFGPSGTLTGFGGMAGGALNNQGFGGAASGGSDNETGGNGDSGAVLWSPANDDSSLDLWFDANNSGSLSRSGSNVNSWTDLASSVTVTATSIKPTYNSNLLNGLPGIVLSGGANCGFTANTSHGSFSGPLSIYAVISIASTAQHAQAIFAALPAPVIAYDPSAVALFAAMTVQPSTARKGAYNALIVALKNAGVWQRLDVLYVLAVGTAQQASLNWINPGTATTSPVGSPVFTTDTGITGSFASSYESTNFSITNYTLNDASAFAWSGSNAQIDTDFLFINPALGTSVTAINPWRVSTNQLTVALNSPGAAYSIPPGSTVGLFTATRTSSASVTVYHNINNLGTAAEVTTGIPGSAMGLAAGTRSVKMVGFGASLTAQNVTDLYNAFNNYFNNQNSGGGTSSGTGETSVAFISNAGSEFIAIQQASITDSQSTQSIGVNVPAVVEWQAPAMGAQNIGDTNIESSGVVGDINQGINTQQIIIPTSGTITSASAYFSTAGGNIIFGIYDNTGAGGEPGHLLATTGAIAAVSGWTTAALNLNVSAGTYYLAFIGSSGSAVVASTGAQGTGWYDQGFAYGSLPSTFTTTGTSWVFSSYVTLSSGGSFGPVTPYINGNLGGTIAPISGYNFTQIGIEVGFTSSTIGDGLIGNMHELIVSTANTNRQHIEGYLAWKWGLQGGLPSNHPYFSIPPTVAGGDGKGGASPHGGGKSSGSGNFPGGGGAGAGTALGQGGGAGGYTTKTYTAGQLTIGANIAYTIGSAGISTFPGANGEIMIAIDQGFGPAPIFIGISYASNTGTVSLPIGVPAGTQNNDLMLAFTSDAPGTIAGAPSGWTLINQLSGGAYDSHLYYRVASNEPASYNWPTTTFPVIAIRTYRGANTANPINSSITTTVSSTSCSIPALSETAAPNEVYIGFWTNNNQNNNLTAPGDLGNLSLNNSNLAWVSGDKIVSGSAGQETATLAGTANYWNAIGVSIKP